MRTIAITGSIAMGKSYIAKIFKILGVKVWDSDQEVAQIINDQPQLIAQSFQDSFIDGKIDKNILASIIYRNDKMRKKLEMILHPLVAKKRALFIKRAKYQRRAITGYEIVLLFEKQYQRLFDQVIVASSSKFLQTKRALARNNLNEEKLKLIMQRQLSDYKKRCKADKVIYTGLVQNSVIRQIKTLL